MELSYKELCDLAYIWNDYRRENRETNDMLYYSLSIIFILLFLAEYILLSNKYPVIAVFSVGLTGIAVSGFFFLRFVKLKRENEKDYEEKMNEFEKERTERFQDLIKKAASLKADLKKRMFEFYYYVKTFNGKQKIFWTGMAVGESSFLLKNPLEYVHIDKKDEFRILKGSEQTFSDYFNAETEINGKKGNISISPYSYNVYLKCLEEDFKNEAQEI